MSSCKLDKSQIKAADDLINFYVWYERRSMPFTGIAGGGGGGNGDREPLPENEEVAAILSRQSLAIRTLIKMKWDQHKKYKEISKVLKINVDGIGYRVEQIRIKIYREVVASRTVRVS